MVLERKNNAFGSSLTDKNTNQTRESRGKKEGAEITL